MTREVTVANIADIKAEVQPVGRMINVTAKTLPFDSGVPGLNMELTWTFVPKGYHTPRHRHVFDQIRYVMEGSFLSRGNDLHAGECCYFPEGVHYGPQQQDADCVALILQFPGPSGEPYLTHNELGAAKARLIAEGARFEGGIYTRILPDGRKINKDAHQACWEALTGREMKFPMGRYPAPVSIKPQAFRWIEDPRHPGVQRKHLGTFGELRTGISQMRLLPGARWPAHRQEDAEMLYLTEGSAVFAGKTWLGGTSEDKGSYFFLPAGCQVGDFSTAEGGTFFVISLPMLSMPPGASTPFPAAAIA